LEDALEGGEQVRGLKGRVKVTRALTERTSTYKMTKWRANDKHIDPTNHMLVHGGMATRDWFSDKLLGVFVSSLRWSKLQFNSPVHGVQHFNGDENGKSHGHWVGVSEDLAVNSLEVIASSQALHVVRQLPEAQLRSVFAVHEPPGSSTNGGGTDISTNSHVTGRGKQ
jgi:hypothetical protein